MATTKKNWKEIDEEFFPEVKKLCEKIYTGDGGRPKRVTGYTVTKAMGWPDKRLDYLPKCKEIVLEYYEDIEAYWTRECVWAYRKLQQEATTITWRKMRDITNMKRINFDERAEKYLNNHTDEDTAEKIRELI